MHLAEYRHEGHEPGRGMIVVGRQNATTDHHAPLGQGARHQGTQHALSTQILTPSQGAFPFRFRVLLRFSYNLVTVY